MKFTVVPRLQRLPDTGVNEAFLRIDHWNDYSFVTMFDVAVFDESGKRFELGAVKIGFSGQTTDISTYQRLEETFESLPEGFFSLGQDVNYYRVLKEEVSPKVREAFLGALKDVAYAQSSHEVASGEEVFRTSLLRSVSVSTIDGQYRRVLGGGAPLSDFNFGFHVPQSELRAEVELNFVVNASSTPSTNVHAIIGRNGVGKTTLLNDMVVALMRPDSTEASFHVNSDFGKMQIDPNYFSSLVSVAFSAFDPFTPPQEQPDPELGTRYYYVGLKDIADETGTLLKSLEALRDECVASLGECFSDRGKRERWRAAISRLESDENFARIELGLLADLSGEELEGTAKKLVKRMSSGHAVVLLTISRLVAKVEEKTLVLLDEPESHLHPPLLAALTRALSDLLHNRNGVAIVATHSPVVLQEVPKSCVWVINRARLSMLAEHPRIETFGENVGVLTREVFGLEVTRSGFHSLLATAVAEGKSYDDVIAEYEGQLGLEARGILRAMVAERDGEGAVA